MRNACGLGYEICQIFTVHGLMREWDSPLRVEQIQSFTRERPIEKAAKMR